MIIFRLSFLFSIVSLLAVSAAAYDPSAPRDLLAHETPRELEGVGVEEYLGRKIDLSLPFQNQAGEAVTLGQVIKGDKPVILTVVYYDCPSLCNYHLNGLLEVMQKMSWTTGEQFDLVAVSMDHKETSEVAAPKLQAYLKEYDRAGSEKGWHFLTGSEESVKSLTDQIGFSFRWDENIQQFAHSAVAYVLTPSGQISRYLYGIQFDPQTVRMSLLEASEGKIGSVIDQIILFCFQFDPSKNKYTLYAFNIMRIGAVVMILIMTALLLPTWLRERRGAMKALKGEA
jgi:protein SCO1/2